jgi:predicted dehydrogenase
MILRNLPPRGLLCLVLAPLLMIATPTLAQEKEPVRLAVAGLSHGHAGWLSQLAELDEYVELVGIAEDDSRLVAATSLRSGFPRSRFYSSLEELLAAENVEAVAAFGSTFEHLKVVEACAPRGIHVMVEKPLAVDLPAARRMAELARRHDVHLLTNYETSWMPGVRYAATLARSGALGEVRRLVFRTGHMGPAKIGLSEQFLDWLTDPVLNGGGALMDFGCYGANLATYILGTPPDSVIRTTQNTQPELYPGIEDVATLLLRYGEVEVVVQAAWNWPHHVKDMDIYGTDGYVLNFHRDSVEIRQHIGTPSERHLRTAAAALPVEERSPFRYFAEVVRGRVEPETYGLYGAENNLVVMEILCGPTR